MNDASKDKLVDKKEDSLQEEKEPQDHFFGKFLTSSHQRVLCCRAEEEPRASGEGSLREGLPSVWHINQKFEKAQKVIQLV